MKKYLAIAVICLLAAACTPMGTLVPPSGEAFKARLLKPEDLAKLPMLPTRVRPGDMLRIVPDSQPVAMDLRNLVEDAQSQNYLVRGDGSFSYRFIGRVDAAGKTPDELAAEMKTRLDAYFREPGVTINITSSPSNRVIVAGAVRNPLPIDLGALSSVEQAIFAAGGLLPAADPTMVALLRMDAQDRYQVYFIDLSKMLEPTEQGRAGLAFQRGDIIFVPKSSAGNAADGVDVYINQLLPFSRAVGFSFSKTVGSNDSTLTVK
jgi:protein involved in polysaccharide export with SLBB domain